VPTKEQYSGSNQYCVGDIHSEKWNGRTKRENVRRMKGTKLKDFEGVLVIWMGQVNVKMEQQLMKLLRNTWK
jgi:hypothetical protein